MQRVKTDPHSPPAVRGTAPLLNQPGFYEAFGIKPGDKMYRPPSDRVQHLVVRAPAWRSVKFPADRRQACAGVTQRLPQIVSH